MPFAAFPSVLIQHVHDLFELEEIENRLRNQVAKFAVKPAQHHGNKNERSRPCSRCFQPRILSESGESGGIGLYPE